MAFKESAEAAAKNPWGQWVAVILALAGCVTAYIDLQSTKTKLEIERMTDEAVEGKADEELASGLSDTQTSLEEVWEYCQRAEKQIRRHSEKQDQAIIDQKNVTRRIAYGLDDVRYTVQLLHPQRPAANFEREEAFTDVAGDLETDYDTIEDEPIVALPKSASKNGLAIKRIDSKRIKSVRKKKKNDMQQMAE